MKLFFILIFSVIACTAQSAQPPASTCGTDSVDGLNYAYCVEPASGANPDALIYLHGAGGSEKSWSNEFSDLFKQEWSKTETGSPAVITLSFGTRWLLGDVETKFQKALLPIVHDKVIPALETKLGGIRGRRFVMGPSMGGYNSAELGLRYPRSFAAVFPLCPGMLTLTMSSTSTEIDDFLKQNSPKVQRRSIEGLLNWIKAVFVTQAQWDRHDPLLLAENATADGPRFYVHSTYDDVYGFYPAAQKFVTTLKARGVTAKGTFLNQGEHCSGLDESAVAEMVDFMK